MFYILQLLAYITGVQGTTLDHYCPGYDNSSSKYVTVT